jgi:hypothetical protein
VNSNKHLDHENQKGLDTKYDCLIASRNVTLTLTSWESSRQRGRYKITNPQLSIEFQGEIKIGRGFQMGAWHQDRLAD